MSQSSIFISVIVVIILGFILSKFKYCRWPFLRQRYSDLVHFIALISFSKVYTKLHMGPVADHLQITAERFSGYFPLSFFIPYFAIFSHLYAIYVALYSFSHRYDKSCYVCPYTSLYRKWTYDCWSGKSESFTSQKLSVLQCHSGKTMIPDHFPGFPLSASVCVCQMNLESVKLLAVFPKLL